MTHKPAHTSSQNHTKQARTLAIMLCLGMLAGVLIWAKLRLVTDIPRSAYADPRELDEQTDPTPNQPIKPSVERVEE